MSETSINAEALKHDYENKRSFFTKLESEANYILDEYVRKSGIKIHDITSRVKQFESFLKKAQNNQMKTPLEEMADIVGLRVICLFLSDIPRIAAIIRQRFVVISEDNKIDGKDASSFGYMSFHLIVTMKPEYTGPRYEDLQSRAFEIQIRTLTMDAWSTISHYLDYKTEVDIPQELRRDFYALSGLFYVADTHFEMFSRARQEVIKKTQHLVNNPNTEMQQDINFESLKAYLAKKFPEREAAPAYSISALVFELQSAWYKTLGQIDYAISRGWEAFRKYESDYPPTSVKYNQVGVVRTLLEIVDPKFAEVRALPGELIKLLENYRILIKPE